MSDIHRLVNEDEAQRSRERLCLKTPVCLIVSRPDRVLLVDARFHDISDDGAAIFAAVEIAVDSEVQVEFTSPSDHRPLRVRAIVRNRREYVYGLEFLPRDGKEEKILQLLKSVMLPQGTKASGDVDNRRWL